MFPAGVAAKVSGTSCSPGFLVLALGSRVGMPAERAREKARGGRRLVSAPGKVSNPPCVPPSYQEQPLTSQWLICAEVRAFHLDFACSPRVRDGGSRVCTPSTNPCTAYSRRPSRERRRDSFIPERFQKGRPVVTMDWPANAVR
ncbi:hypothetical protein VTK73DRAFT_1502 [Phialemonium thermophilum]|uniref:Secreted protein n=1 Tax=Phialemonium thermophilum TaxID=223376 RepID=A0ABR3VTC2_9PEZI